MRVSFRAHSEDQNDDNNAHDKDKAQKDLFRSKIYIGSQTYGHVCYALANISLHFAIVLRLSGKPDLRIPDPCHR